MPAQPFVGVTVQRIMHCVIRSLDSRWRVIRVAAFKRGWAGQTFAKASQLSLTGDW
jgi:hypothetical protein